MRRTAPNRVALERTVRLALAQPFCRLCCHLVHPPRRAAGYVSSNAFKRRSASVPEYPTPRKYSAILRRALNINELSEFGSSMLFFTTVRYMPAASATRTFANRAPARPFAFAASSSSCNVGLIQLGPEVTITSARRSGSTSSGRIASPKSWHCRATGITALTFGISVTGCWEYSSDAQPLSASSSGHEHSIVQKRLTRSTFNLTRC